jgi:hypothetical protein
LSIAETYYFEDGQTPEIELSIVPETKKTPEYVRRYTYYEISGTAYRPRVVYYQHIYMHNDGLPGHVRLYEYYGETSIIHRVHCYEEIDHSDPFNSVYTGLLVTVEKNIHGEIIRRTDHLTGEDTTYENGWIATKTVIGDDGNLHKYTYDRVQAEPDIALVGRVVMEEVIDDSGLVIRISTFDYHRDEQFSNTGSWKITYESPGPGLVAVIGQAPWEGYYQYDNDENRLHKKVESNGRATIFFDAEMFPVQTHWNLSGDITHYNTPADGAAGRAAWYFNAVTQELDVYTRYESGSVRFKSVYTMKDGVWTWSESYEHDDAGGPDSWDSSRVVGREEAGASETFDDMPEKPVYTPLAPAEVSFAGLIFSMGMMLSVRKPREKDDGDDFTVTMGLPKEMLDEFDLMEQAYPGFMENLMKGTKVDRIVFLKDDTKQGMLDELNRATLGQRTIATIMDIGVVNDMARESETGWLELESLTTIMSEFADRARTDIIRLMNPEETSFNAKTVREIKDIGKLREILTINVRLFPDAASFDLAGKSVFDMRINRISEKYHTDYSEETAAMLNAISEDSGLRGRYMVSAVDNMADLRLIGESISERRRSMKVEREEDPVRDIVILKNKDISEIENASEKRMAIAKLMEISGLSGYISPDKVVVIDPEDTLSPENVMELISVMTGEDVSPNQVSIGSKAGVVDVNTTNPGELFDPNSRENLLLVQLGEDPVTAGEGLVSQLYRLTMELTVNKEIQREGLSRVRGFNLFIYLPKIEKVDMEELIEYERMIRAILIMA